jgi:hypothetical protein
LGLVKFVAMVLVGIVVGLWIPQRTSLMQHTVEFSDVTSLLETPATSGTNRLKRRLQDAILLERRKRPGEAEAIYHDVLFHLSQNDFDCTALQSKFAAEYVRSRLRSLDDGLAWRLR